MMPAKRIERFVECDEVAWDESGSLMNQLIKGVLAIGTWLAPIDRTCVDVHRLPIEGHALAIAFHNQLLEISRKSLEVLFIGQYRYTMGSQKIVVPDCQETHEHRQIPLKRCSTKVLVHLVKTIEHCPEVVRADG